MNSIAEKNRKSWNDGSDRYSAKEHVETRIKQIIESPASAFPKTTWELIQKALPSPEGKRICIPSSGNNHAAFAFTLLGAHVTSCDISENQLVNAKKVADRYGLNIEFLRADTMTLEGVPSGTYDFVYTSNGVHVWINDLPSMYRSINRIMKPGATYIMHEIHPFQRPFDGNNTKQLTIVKPYSSIGPFESNIEVTFHWRIQDILNAMLDSGLSLRHMEEMDAEIDFEDPYWVPLEQQLTESGLAYDKSEIQKMYDWRINPMSALPQLMSFVAVKEA